MTLRNMGGHLQKRDIILVRI